MQPLRIDVWSDIACPWCYVGKRRLEAALAQLKLPEPAEVVWHSFELDPQGPRTAPTTTGYAERLATKYRVTPARAEQMLADMRATGQVDGLDLRFDRARGGNTFDAHRLLHLASTQGKQDALKERFMRAYFTDGAAIGDPAVLAALAIDVGLPAAEVQTVLDGTAYADDVRGDEAQARELGITGVPFFVLDGRLALSGAQPVATMVAAITDALAARTQAAVQKPTLDGSSCDVDGCA